MNLTRNGKIARMPRPLRQELNRRRHETEKGKLVPSRVAARSEMTGEEKPRLKAVNQPCRRRDENE